MWPRRWLPHWHLSAKHPSWIRDPGPNAADAWGTATASGIISQGIREESWQSIVSNRLSFRQCLSYLSEHISPAAVHSLNSTQASSWHREGNGTPLQYSCLENPMDRGAWWATVHGVTRSRTWLSNFTFTFHFHALEKETATHSSVLAWRIPGMAESGGLPSMRAQRVGHDWSDLAAAAALDNACTFWKLEFQI